jgi:hypothetical protein
MLINPQPTQTQLFPTTDPILMLLPFASHAEPAKTMSSQMKTIFYNTIPTRNPY